LLRICAGHPALDVVHAGGGTQVGMSVASVYPHLAPAYPDLTLESGTPTGLDVAFLALPHGVSQEVIPHLDAGVIVDLGGDFRHKEGFVYGLVELFREEVAGATRVSVPGCYVTAAVLTIAPLLREGLAEPAGIVVDAYSGVTGAGREPKSETMFATVAESLTAYALLDHRHTPEMETALTRHVGGPVELLFTPHLAPANRGILATCYLRPTGSESTDELLEAMTATYKGEPFIEVSDRIPATKSTLGSNSVHMTVRRDPRTGWIVAIGALDNLMKGAAGQAVQCANLALGIDETTGLAATGVYP
jgi:N-acetyl-gamma-glutamyl-phosphate reductase